jgi:hypothetical protein
MLGLRVKKRESYLINGSINEYGSKKIGFNKLKSLLLSDQKLQKKRGFLLECV